jgi:hypothetical protein
MSRLCLLDGEDQVELGLELVLDRVTDDSSDSDRDSNSVITIMIISCSCLLLGEDLLELGLELMLAIGLLLVVLIVAITETVIV